MALEDIMEFFPVANMATKGVTQGLGGLIPGVSEAGNNQLLMGLLAPSLFGGSQQQQDPYAQWRPNQFLSQGGVQTGQMSPAQGQGQMSPAQGQDPLSLLDANINRRFGI